MANVEGWIARNFGMRVQKAHQRRVRRKIGLIGQETGVEHQDATQRRRIMIEKYRQLVPDSLGVGLLDGQNRWRLHSGRIALWRLRPRG